MLSAQERSREYDMKMVWLAALLGLLGAAMGCEGEASSTSDGGSSTYPCPSRTEPLSPDDERLFRQIEDCASEIHGISLRRDELPRVELDPERVPCDQSPSGECVLMPDGTPVVGYHRRDCNTITAVMPSAIAHESLHAILCDVPSRSCDGDHESPAWGQCLVFFQCQDGTRILNQLRCDGIPHCALGEDESSCP